MELVSKNPVKHFGLKWVLVIFGVLIATGAIARCAAKQSGVTSEKLGLQGLASLAQSKKSPILALGMNYDQLHELIGDPVHDEIQTRGGWAGQRVVNYKVASRDFICRMTNGVVRTITLGGYGATSYSEPVDYKQALLDIGLKNEIATKALMISGDEQNEYTIKLKSAEIPALKFRWAGGDEVVQDSAGRDLMHMSYALSISIETANTSGAATRDAGLQALATLAQGKKSPILALGMNFDQLHELLGDPARDVIEKGGVQDGQRAVSFRLGQRDFVCRMPGGTVKSININSYRNPDDYKQALSDLGVRPAAVSKATLTGEKKSNVYVLKLESVQEPSLSFGWIEWIEAGHIVRDAAGREQEVTAYGLSISIESQNGGAPSGNSGSNGGGNLLVGQAKQLVVPEAKASIAYHPERNEYDVSAKKVSANAWGVQFFWPIDAAQISGRTVRISFEAINLDEGGPITVSIRQKDGAHSAAGFEKRISPTGDWKRYSFESAIPATQDALAFVVWAGARAGDVGLRNISVLVSP